MAVTFRSSSTATANAGTGISISAPAGIAAGDLLVLWTAGYYSATAPAGWTSLGTQTSTGGTLPCNGRIAYKWATAGDVGATWTISYAGSDQSAAAIVAYTGFASGFTPTPALAGTHSTGNTASFSTPTATNSSGDLVLSLWGAESGAAASNITPAAGPTTRVQAGSPGGYTHVASADETGAGGTSTARSASIDIAGTSWYSATVVVATSTTVHLTSTGTFDGQGMATLHTTPAITLTVTGGYDGQGAALIDRSAALTLTGGFDGQASTTLNRLTHLTAAGETDIDGDTGLEVATPIAPVPIPVSPRVLRRVSYCYDYPTLDPQGRVAQQNRHLITNEPYGYEQIIIDGVDVTWDRDTPTRIVSWSWGEPLGPKDLLLAFPQYSPFETPPAWLAEGKRVDVRLVLPTGSVRATPLFEGFIHKVRPDGTLRQVAEVLGFGWQGDLQQQKPRFYYPGHEIVDVGTRAPSALNDVIGRHYPRVPLITSGYDTQKKGSLEQSRCDFCLEVLDQAPGYTIIDRTERGRRLWMRQRDVTTIHYTFAVGQHGLDISGLDRQPGANVVYGEYISPQGGRSQNVHYPFYADDDSLEGAIHLPFASDTTVEPFLYDSDGRVTGPNPAYDPTKLRVETFYQGGEGITRQNMIDSSQQILTDAARGWHLVGELVATTDPEEGHRFDIRAGRNVLLKHMYGGGVLLPVQTVDIDRESGTVRMGVDQQARPAPTVAKIIQLQRAAKADPAASYRRSSKTSQDTHPVFDADTKAGQVRPISVPARQWVARSFPATDYGEFVELVASISPACEWSIALWDRRPDVNWLASTVGDPTSTSQFVENPWTYFADDLDARGWINGWGYPGQPGGYSPGAKYRVDRDGNSLPDGPLTGKILDEDSMTFVSQDAPKLWVTVYAQTSGTASILFRAAPVEF